MKTFEMIRETDVSGISGTGKVVEGVVFADGHTVIRWCVSNGLPNSLVFYDRYEDFLAIAVTGHPENRTKLVWSDSAVDLYGPGAHP